MSNPPILVPNSDGTHNEYESPEDIGRVEEQSEEPEEHILPGSGKITLKQIGTEFEDKAPHRISDVDDILCNLGGPCSGPIRFTNFYGKENTAFVNVTGSPRNVVLRTLLNNQGQGHIRKVVCKVKGGARVGSNSTGSYAFHSGTLATGSTATVTVENNAHIIGRGGNGGAGGKGKTKGSNGGKGGGAFYGRSSGSKVYLVRNSGSVVKGGGGGGGGGGGHYYGETASKSGCGTIRQGTGSGGKGGSGLPNGSNGSPTSPSYYAGVGGAGGTISESGKNGGAGGTGCKGSCCDRFKAAGGTAGAGGTDYVADTTYVEGDNGQLIEVEPVSL
ncbi:hypothetical protein ABXV18_24360 [Vibrio owensii]|uniref:hypothetical protein n=1 Tax=Vibrio owensii TaxID=696485 RepID=UPI003399C586